MEPTLGTVARSSLTGSEATYPRLESLQFGEDIQHLISVPPESGSQFTALLELPPCQAIELLRSPDSDLMTRPVLEHSQGPLPQQHFNTSNLTFPTNSGLIERAARFSVFAGENMNNTNNNSPETSSVPSKSCSNIEKAVKSEPSETESYLNSSTLPLVSDPTVDNAAQSQRWAKRKEREKKVRGSSKKSKGAANESSQGADKLPYVHVRARRGQATDSHSLAERARREKINARMKLLQELVPGCHKISGTALVLDEIISHVQSLQRQVEVLSMRLAAVNPGNDFNIDSILAAEIQPLNFLDKQGFFVNQWGAERHSYLIMSSHAINVDTEREDECGICMEMNSKIVLPNCNHSMCVKCYRDWHSRSQSCPFCRDSLKRVNSGDLWVFTDSRDIVDMATVMRENLRRLFKYIDKLPLIVPESLFDTYDSHLR